MRPVPPLALEFLARVESCVLRVYDDARPDHILAPGDKVLGRLTAGYGHTGPDLRIGMDILPAAARGWLTQDADIAARRLCDVVEAVVVADLTDHQYAALVSFVFNLGANPGWTIWKRLNERKFDQVPLEMAKFVNARIGGDLVKVQGLVNRRAAEVALWSTGEPGTVPDLPPSSVTRATATPPTPADTTTKSKGLVLGVVGAAAGAGPMLNQATQAIQPYAVHSDYVAKALGVLAAIAAVCALAAVAYMYLSKREARN